MVHINNNNNVNVTIIIIRNGQKDNNRVKYTTEGTIVTITSLMSTISRINNQQQSQ